MLYGIVTVVGNTVPEIWNPGVVSHKQDGHMR